MKKVHIMSRENRGLKIERGFSSFLFRFKPRITPQTSGPMPLLGPTNNRPRRRTPVYHTLEPPAASAPPAVPLLRLRLAPTRLTRRNACSTSATGKNWCDCGTSTMTYRAMITEQHCVYSTSPTPTFSWLATRSTCTRRWLRTFLLCCRRAKRSYKCNYHHCI